MREGEREDERGRSYIKVTVYATEWHSTFYQKILVGHRLQIKRLTPLFLAHHSHSLPPSRCRRPGIPVVGETSSTYSLHQCPKTKQVLCIIMC